jgi:putative tryptophan/tyrosine transport system substrate-binding protein
MRRREVLVAFAGALASPFAARAQQGEHVRPIAMLSEFSEAQMQPLVAAFRDQLQRSGWKDGAFQIDRRFAITDAAQFKDNASAIVATHPDLIVALGSRALRALKVRVHRTCRSRRRINSISRST